MSWFAGACFVAMWAATLANVYAAEHMRRTYGREWSAWVYGSLAMAFAVSAMDAWVWL